MTLKIEEITLSKLILNDTYTKKVLPFIKDEYYDSQSPVSYTHLTLPTTPYV